MLISNASVDAAIDTFLADVALGRPWTGIMERLSLGVGAHSACLSKMGGNRLRLLNTPFHAQTMSRLGRDGNPPFTHDVLTPPRRADGFVSDAMPSLQAKLRRVPLYTDFMVENDFGWRSTVHLDGPEDETGVRLTFWRGRFEGPFLAADLALMRPLISAARFAARFSRTQVDEFSCNEAAPYMKRDEPVFGLDLFGKASPMNPAAEALVAPGPRLVNGRLAVSYAIDQKRLDAAIASALAGSSKAAAVNLMHDTGSSRLQFLILPLRQDAQDILGTSQAIAVLLDLDRSIHLKNNVVMLLADAFDLTDREIDVVAAIASGQSINAIAHRLGISEGTTRNHVKAVFQKTGVHSQTALQALVSRYH